MHELLDQHRGRLNMLHAQGGRLSDSLRRLAAVLIETGEPPSEGMIQELQGFRSAFDDLRNRLLAEGDDANSTRGVKSLSDLGEELDARASVHQALLVLDRLESIRAVGAGDLSTWRRCLAEVHELRCELRALPVPQSRELAARVLSLEHPLAAVDALVCAGDTLSDERWWSLHEAVAGTYGRDLSTAIVRRRLLRP